MERSSAGQLLLCLLLLLAGGTNLFRGSGAGSDKAPAAGVAVVQGAFLPPRTTATRWTGDMVLCYVDARSTPGGPSGGGQDPGTAAEFGWSPERFARLLAYHNASAEEGGGVPMDTLFDAFLLIGYEWFGGKKFWPGEGLPMNKTDWLDFLALQLTAGAANLDAAAANVSTQLPVPPPPGGAGCTAGGLRPTVVLAVPYPDPRLQDFGPVNDEPGGRSLNFSLAADRATAVQWWVREAHAQWQAAGFRHAVLGGFYWFLEEIATGDEVLVPAVAATVHAPELSGGALMFGWIPYYRPGDPHTGQWRELGFDFATLQPNYAFNNVSAANRFPAIRALVENFTLGVELELDVAIRNPQAGGWQGNFATYLHTVRGWETGAAAGGGGSAGGSIMKTYYNGNVFVTYFAAQQANFSFYTQLWDFVKGRALPEQQPQQLQQQQQQHPLPES